MKVTLKVSMLACSLVFAGCGSKKNTSTENLISDQYQSTLDSYYSIVNPSTLDLEKLKDLPRQVDLKNKMTPAKDQADRGTCSFFTAIALTESAIKTKMNIEVNLSEEYLNYSTKSDGIYSKEEGSFPEKNLKVAITKKKGFLLERDWPYQPSWFGEKAPCIENGVDGENTPEVCYSHTGPTEDILTKVIPGDKFNYAHQTATTNDLIEILAVNKMPFAIGLPVNLKGWADNGEVDYSDNFRQQCMEHPEVCGAHAITITGYDMDKKVFMFKNSWGTKWGKDGYGTIPFETIDLYAQLDITVVKLDENLTLPADYAKDYLSFISFDIISEQAKNNEVKITTAGVVKNAGLYTLKTGTSLVKRKDGATGDLTDDNTEVLELSAEDAGAIGDNTYVTAWHSYFADPSIKDRVWTMADDVLLAPAEKMNLASVQKFAPIYSNLFFRTTLYVYTDNQKYKVLKRYYHSLNYGK